jgi:glycosyltransferase involved in cell wall biosynthesis
MAASRTQEAAPPSRRPVVALVSDVIFPYHCGGREIRYHEVSRRLTGCADVHLYTMHWWDGPATRKEDAVTLHAISPLRSLYTHTRRSLRQAIVFAIGCFRLLSARFDVLEADHMPLVQIPALWFVATVKRKRFVVTWHEVWGLSYWRQYLGWAGVIAWLLEEVSMRLPDHIIAASSHTAQRLRASLGPRASITVAPNGIDLDAVRAAYPDPAGTDLVVVSRLMSHKRISLLLEVVAYLHAQGQPVTCRIIGDGPERDDLLAQAQAENIDWAIDFRHDVREQKEVYSLLKAAKVFVLPSTREGFGIAVLEALACGIPVVTTSDHDNLAQYLAERSSKGVVCDPTVPAIADAVQKLLARHGLSADDGIDGDDAWLAEYTWDATTDRLIKALRI